MAGRILDRRKLREQADQAEQLEAEAPEDSDASEDSADVAPKAKKPRAKKAAGPPKARKPRAKKAPPRLCARWGIFDNGMKQVAIFNYNQRAAADEKLAELLAKKKGIHFMQIVKEAMPEPAPVEALAVSV